MLPLDSQAAFDDCTDKDCIRAWRRHLRHSIRWILISRLQRASKTAIPSAIHLGPGLQIGQGRCKYVKLSLTFKSTGRPAVWATRSVARSHGRSKTPSPDAFKTTVQSKTSYMAVETELARMVLVACVCASNEYLCAIRSGRS